MKTYKVGYDFQIPPGFYKNKFKTKTFAEAMENLKEPEDFNDEPIDSLFSEDPIIDTADHILDHELNCAIVERLRDFVNDPKRSYQDHVSIMVKTSCMAVSLGLSPDITTCTREVFELRKQEGKL